MLLGKQAATVAKYGANHSAATRYLWPDAFGAKKSRLFGQIRPFGLREAILPFSGRQADFILPSPIFGFPPLDFLRRAVVSVAEH